MKKLVNENINDILKPKDLKSFIGKYFIKTSSTTQMIEYIIKIVNIIDNGFLCKVIYNTYAFSGTNFHNYLNLDENRTFFADYGWFKEFVTSAELKELSDINVKHIENKIRQLEVFRDFLKELLNK